MDRVIYFVLVMLRYSQKWVAHWLRPQPPSSSVGEKILLFLIIDAEGCGVPHLISTVQHTPGM